MCGVLLSFVDEFPAINVLHFQNISVKFLKEGFFLKAYLCTKGEPNWRNVLH